MVLCTFPDAKFARQICSVLVTEGLAACANLLPGVESIYRWECVTNLDSETLAILKLPADGLAAMESKLLGLHPYEVPEIVAIRPDAVNPACLAWVNRR